MNVTRLARVRCLGACLLFCLATAQASSTGRAPELPDPGHPRMTREQQERFGLQAAAQIYQQMPVLPDSSPETQYIQALGKRLAAVIPPDRSWPYQFHVVAQKEVNAFALPGGPMFVNIGTIAMVDNEAELAGVMAHEMSHVYMQHSAKQQQHASLVNGIAGIVGAIAGGFGDLGTLAASGIQFGAGSLMLKYSRGDEAQADAVGAIILWKAHFNPVALADFFKKLQGESKNGPQFLSDHPNPGNRDAAIKKEIRDWPPRNYTPDSPQFATVRSQAAAFHSYTAQQIAAGAKSGRWAEYNASKGAIFKGLPSSANSTSSTTGPTASVPFAPFSAVQPSSNFRAANIGEVTIDRPDNWHVMPGQQSSVTIAPTAGASGAAVAYGVVIESVTLDASATSIQQTTTSIAQSLESGDDNMKQIGDLRTVSVDGMQAGTMQLTSVSPMPGQNGSKQPERDWLVVVPRGGGTVIYFVFVAPQSDFAQLRPTFEKMLGSVRF